ncbi:malic enzyme-like NAD(P)-binding protein [Fundidesulfovibrio putealis]|uniref:malic enzyme-like NAD(P)-binding protein n=1 Tax=Fundidesulfovibrio putealis TaxID=270496 RepID=UPI0004230693|nr:malic enzyme-like NAD(P)-binding protein [Fundidesulfovibrio putealis]
MALFTKEEALRYHSAARVGKLEVVPCKPFRNQKDLSMAYSPGVAEACREIHADPAKVYDYTNRGNNVAVVSNGTAVLGLGNIGPKAGKPVMEGKGFLFKIFADIDVYDLNINAAKPEQVIEFCKMLEPSVGGINLEDIKAPECFEIEQALIEMLEIPVFHDDQHGTAIVSAAGLLNACEITGKKLEDLRVVVSGAGAAAIACSKLYEAMGIQRSNIAMFDTRGHINKSRTNLHSTKAYFGDVQKIEYASLGEAMKGADVFLGLSVKGAVNQDMVKGMAKDPVIFAMANPDPEISYADAKAARPDAIMGTGRSDFPNQVNNVSGFPFIFRGALDAGSKKINEEMKMAAAKAIAALAKEPVPSEICDMYGVKELKLGIDYIMPKALDFRMLEWEAPAVAKAAMETGVATKKLDLEQYAKDLRKRMDDAHSRMNQFLGTYDLSMI